LLAQLLGALLGRRGRDDRQRGLGRDDAPGLACLGGLLRLGLAALDLLGPPRGGYVLLGLGEVGVLLGLLVGELDRLGLVLPPVLLGRGLDRRRRRRLAAEEGLGEVAERQLAHRVAPAELVGGVDDVAERRRRAE